MPLAPQIDAPISLGSFFPDEDEEENLEDETRSLDQCFETQTVTLVGRLLLVRQFAFHSHNANRVWPGTFNLAEYLLAKETRSNDENNNDEFNDDDFPFLHHWGNVLELGTATGLLAIRLALDSSQHYHQHSCNDDDDDATNKQRKNFVCDLIVTSDFNDEEIEDHVRHNFEINYFSSSEDNDEKEKRNDNIPIHVPHTWGTGWYNSASQRGLGGMMFNTIVASDILLYVSAYPSLVQTLTELMPPPGQQQQQQSPIFIMSWNRRMKESMDFFERMQRAGFEYRHEGKCIYTFTRVKGT